MNLGEHALHEGRRSLRRPKGLHFIVYASARTGSTSLRLALDCYRGIYCANEPFNEDVPGNVRGRISDLASLKRETERLWRHYNGIKHIWQPDRSRFSDPAMEDYLLTAAAERIVFLNRRNLLQRIVSTQMSEQNRVWQMWGEQSRGKIMAHHYEPLDKAALRTELQAEREASMRVRQRLQQSGRPYMDLWYEDLFGSQSREQKLHALGGVFAFVTGRPFQRALLRPNASKLLDADTNKVNSPQTYRLVPAIDEIEDEFGSEETGFLFR